MPKLKLTRHHADAAQPQAKEYDIRDTVRRGLHLKVTPSGRKMFVLAYTAANRQRRKPAIGPFGEITVEQGRAIAQDCLAEVRRGNDPSAVRAAARAAPTLNDFCQRFLDDCSIPRNKPGTVKGNDVNINAHIVPTLGHLATRRSDLVGLTFLNPTRSCSVCRQPDRGCLNAYASSPLISGPDATPVRRFDR